MVAFKRALAKLLILSLLCTLFPPLSVSAAQVDTIVNVTNLVKNDTKNQPSYTEQPVEANIGDHISFYLKVENTGTIPLTNAVATSRFFDDQGQEMSFTGSGFTLVQPDIKMSTTTGSVHSRVSPIDVLSLPTLNDREYFYFQEYTIALDQTISTHFIRHVWTVSEGNANEKSEETLIHVSIRPEVRNIQFTKQSLIGNGVDSTTLQAYIYDGNGCSDIALVRANLHEHIAGRTIDEDEMHFVNCDTEGVALYELPNIQLTTDPRDITVSVIATDTQNNTSQVHQTQPSAVLTIAQDQSPKVTVTAVATNIGNSTQPILVDGTRATEAHITWQTDKPAHYYLRKSQNPSGQELRCESAGIGMQTNLQYSFTYNLDNRAIGEDPREMIPANTSVTSVIPAHELDQNGIWYIRICAASEEDQRLYQGSETVKIEKVPATGLLVFDKYEFALTDVPGDTLDITWRNATVDTGSYKFFINGVDLSKETLPSTTINAVGEYPGIPVSTRLDASHFQYGVNDVTLEFTDALGNTISRGVTISLVSAPDPVTNVEILEDDDTNHGLDIRDIVVQWDAYEDNEDFHSYAVYILNVTTPFQDAVHQPIAYVNSRIDSTGTKQTFRAEPGQESYRNTDSEGNVLEPGVEYRAYVQVQNKALQRSVATASTNTRSYAIDGRPEVVQGLIRSLGSETSSGSILLTFDSALDPSRSVDPSLITGPISNPSNFIISGNTLAFTIDPIVTSTGTTGYATVLHIAENTVFNPSGLGNLPKSDLFIADGIAPVITIHRPNTWLTINDLLTLEYSFSEPMEENSLIATIRLVEGVNDPLAPHTVLLDNHTSAVDIHRVHLPISDLNRNGDSITTDTLVSGGVYEITITGRDKHGNEGHAVSSRFLVDTGNMLTAAVPQAVHGNDFTITSMPTLTWLPAQNTNARNAITNYTVELFHQGEDTPYASIYEIDATSVVVPINNQLPTPGTYEFRVVAIDSTGNRVISTKRPFVYVSEGTIISDVSLRNETNPSYNAISIQGKDATIAFEGGHTLSLEATLVESLAGITPENITATIRDTSSGAVLILTNPTYTNGLVVFTKTIQTLGEGDYTIELHVEDNAGIQTSSAAIPFVIDNTRPVFDNAVLNLDVTINPNNQERIFREGESMQITWNPAGIQESNFSLTPITLRLLNQGQSIALITSQALNSGSFTWEVPAGINLGNLTLELIARDALQRETSISFQDHTLPIIIDNTAPSSYPHILTPNTSDIVVSANTPYTITWGTNYHDELTPRNNYFVLAFSHDGGATWTDITTVNTANGSYDWTVPSNISSQNAYIRITSYDRAGNFVSDESNAPFRIDSTQAEILTALTQDIDANGYIDAIELTYNKPIDESTLTIQDFEVNGYTITHATVSGNIVVLHLSEGTIYDTDATPTLQYVQGTLADTSGSLAVSQQLITTDMSPAILVQTTFEDTNTNGYIDRATLTFSEVLSPNTDLTPWTFINLPAGGTVSTMEVVANTIIFTITEDTSHQPSTTTEQIGVSFGGGSLADLAGVPVLPFQVQGNAITDSISPVFTAEFTELATSTAISPVQGQVQVIFSEPVQGSTPITVPSDWIIPGFTINDVEYSLNASDQITELTLLLQEPVISTTDFPTLSFVSTGSTITDAYNNTLQSRVEPLNDRIGPKVISVSIHDENGNSAIDEVHVLLSEPITNVNLTDIYINGASSLAGYAIEQNTLRLLLSTEITSTSIDDVRLSWNAAAFTDLYNNPVRALNADDYTGIDTVGPQLTQARYITANRTIVLTFSEALTGQDAIGNSVEIRAATDLFQISNGGSIAGSTVKFYDSTPNQIFLELGQNDEPPLLQQSVITLREPSYILDLAGNQAAPNQSTTIIGSLLINEINWGEAGEEWIEIKNLDTTPITFSSNAPYSIYKNDQRIALLTSGTIDANGFLVVSKNPISENALLDTHFVLDVNYVIAPDLDLTLTGPTTYHLHASEYNQAYTMIDAAGTHPTASYFAGDNGTVSGIIASMERRITATNGLLETSWQTSTVSNGYFDIPTVQRRGTPGAENTLGSTGPVIDDGTTTIGETRTPAPGTLTPSPLPVISASYSDGSDGSTLDLHSTTLTINGIDVTANATITPTGIHYVPTHELQPGQHTVVLTIYDTEGRMAQTSWNFWIDDYRVEITNPPVLFLLNAPGAETSIPVQRTTVAITTYGAEVRLAAQLRNLLESGTTTIPAYQPTPETGLSYEVATLTQPASLPAPTPESIVFTNTFTGLATSYAFLTDAHIPATSPSELQTHYFVIQYRLSVPATQGPDVYTTTLELFPLPTF